MDGSPSSRSGDFSAQDRARPFAWLIGPFALAFAVSLAMQPVLYPRYLICSLPAGVILAANPHHLDILLPGLTYVSGAIRVTYMEKTQVYLRKEELDALRKAAARSKRSVAALVREAVRKVILMPPAEGPVAIWDGEPKRSSIEHDSVYDEP